MKTDRELLQLALDVMSSKWNMDKRRKEKALVEEIKAKLANEHAIPSTR